MTARQASLTRRAGADAAELARLAWPVVLSRSGVMLMALVDTIMVGRYASLDLAYLSIGLAPFGPMLVAGVGICMGTQVVTAMIHGEGRLGDGGAVWRRGAAFAFGLGLIGLLVCLMGEALLLALGQTPDLAAKGGEVLAVLGLGLPFVLFFIASNFFLEGLKRPMAGMVLMIVANVANVFLNWALIAGNAGFPELGAFGSAWATTLVRIGLAAAIAVYIWNLSDHAILGIRRRAGGDWSSWARQRAIGYASAAAIGGESLGFAALGVFAGYLGALALGAHAILFNLLAFNAMIAIGIASATSVRVGFSRGAENHADARLAGWVGLGFGVAVMGCIGLALALFPGAVAGFYSLDPALIETTEPLIRLLGVIVVIDGGRLVMNAALRGRGETWRMVVCNLMPYLVLMVPLAWWLGPGSGGGVAGLYNALLASSVIALTAMSSLFHWLGRRDPDHRS